MPEDGGCAVCWVGGRDAQNSAKHWIDRPTTRNRLGTPAHPTPCQPAGTGRTKSRQERDEKVLPCPRRRRVSDPLRGPRRERATRKPTPPRERDLVACGWNS